MWIQHVDYHTVFVWLLHWMELFDMQLYLICQILKCEHILLLWLRHLKHCHCYIPVEVEYHSYETDGSNQIKLISHWTVDWLLIKYTLWVLHTPKTFQRLTVNFWSTDFQNTDFDLGGHLGFGVLVGTLRSQISLTVLNVIQECSEIVLIMVINSKFGKGTIVSNETHCFLRSL